MKPVLFVTGHAPFDRVGAFARLHQREDVEFALFGGRSQHGPPVVAVEAEQPGGKLYAAGRAPLGELPFHAPERAPLGELPLHPPERAPLGELPFPHRYVDQRHVGALAASGRYRAVVCSTGGRLALPSAWAGARRARLSLILWSALWAHPRSAAHALSYPALRRLYHSADAIVTYGPHVSAYVAARGARNVHIAPQSVDNAFWGSAQVRSPSASSWPRGVEVKFLFAGRPAREKGLRVLIEAWSDSGLRAPSAALVLAGVGSAPPWVPAGGAVRSGAGWPGVSCLEPVSPVELRNMYADADALVLPSIPTRTFREPWGLVVNEAMNRQLPVIASDAVGAVAGGLVRDGHTGLVVPAGDSSALAEALRRIATDASLRARLGAAGGRAIQEYTHDAWATGFSQALASLGLSRERRW
jgi:glycosyltransferase involved in cell wall biosynthesis